MTNMDPIFRNGLVYEYDQETETHWAWKEEDQLYYAIEEEVPTAEKTPVAVESIEVIDEPVVEVVETPQSPIHDPIALDNEAPELYYSAEFETYLWKGQTVYFDEEADNYFVGEDEASYAYCPEDVKRRINEGDVVTWPDAGGLKVSEADAETSAGSPQAQEMEFPDHAADTTVRRAVDDKGFPIVYDHNGEPLLNDQFGRPVEFDENGEPIIKNEAGLVVSTEDLAVEQESEPELEPEPEPVVDKTPIPVTMPDPLAPVLDNPVMPRASGASLTAFNDHDSTIFQAGCESLVKVFECKELIDHYRVQRWGDYLVGRCKRSFAQLVSNQVELKSITHRLEELSGSVNFLNEVQLLHIRNNNQNCNWYDSPVPALRSFSGRVESALPVGILARCIMKGIDPVAGKTTIFIPKYGPKDTKDPLVEQTQKLMKCYTQQHLINMGRYIVLIEGAISEHCPSFKGKQFVLPKAIDDTGAVPLFYNTDDQTVTEIRATDCCKLALGNSRAGGLYEWKIHTA